jgi:hypothetical protein
MADFALDWELVKIGRRNFFILQTLATRVTVFTAPFSIFLFEEKKRKDSI